MSMKYVVILNAEKIIILDEISFLIFTQNIDFVYSLEPPQRGGSNECPQLVRWF